MFVCPGQKNETKVLHLLNFLLIWTNTNSEKQYPMLRLYMAMRANLDDNWLKFLPHIVKALNQRRLKRIGFLSPADITSNLDDVKVQRALAEHKIEPYKQPNWRQQDQNQINYEKSKKELQVGTYVYKDEKPHIFSKSYDAHVSYKIFFPRRSF